MLNDDFRLRNMCLKQVILSMFLLLGVGVAHAQNLEYGVELDTNYMLIGDQQHLTFKVRSDAETRVLFPQLKDTVTRGVEIISGPVRDSVWEDDGKWVLTEEYVITAFDTGVYVIPSMPITVRGEEYDNVLRTEQVGFAVNTFEVDPEKGNYDIVLPYAAPWTFAEILPYLLWTLLGLAVIAGAWFLWQRRKKHQPLFMPKKEVIPPYVKAIRSLDAIKEEKLWQPGNEKEYYTRLTDTVRSYLDGELGISAMEQTSTEILHELKQCDKVEAVEREKIEEMLTTADYVKFAKFTPLQDENARHLDTAYAFVQTTHERLRAEEQRRAEEERKRLEEEKKADEEADKKNNVQ